MVQVDMKTRTKYNQSCAIIKIIKLFIIVIKIILYSLPIFSYAHKDLKIASRVTIITTTPQ